ncbi:DUF397 domain-containing protein [Streptomyces sp. SID3343]|uniref:DUF397 domain-containing protein n=1 Tax=Streptomyces sp. SID3343 TaxID=2690260 RepID=UPI00136860D1|nr:DUF397 domain-containing protein [Streptomyces sp. SID3343]MYW02996.1 DUF397 domain-containing protein [Streptomyces sp. SID3343]
MSRISQGEFTPWRKSSYSNGDGGNCVEIADGHSVVPVRDSKDPRLGHLTITGASWSAFVGVLRAG